MLQLGTRLGIDLGTATIVVYMSGRGIVLREPSVVAVAMPGRRLLAVGEEARQMLGRTPGSIVAVRPLRSGVIADYTITRDMLAHLLRRACGRKLLLVKPMVVICVPSGATNVEKRAALDAARSAGARDAVPIEEPMAAAIGAGLPIAMPGGNMVVDIGGGTTDIAVISLGGIVTSDSVRAGGNDLDEAIIRHVRRVYNLDIGERTAENIKITIGSAATLERELEMAVRGRDILSGLPRTVTVTSVEVREAIADVVYRVVERVKAVLEDTPPELAADIVERGITLTGGGALLRGIERVLAYETGIPAAVADDPVSCVAKGTGYVLQHVHRLRGKMEVSFSS